MHIAENDFHQENQGLQPGALYEKKNFTGKKLEEVKDFVTVASKCDFDVDVFYNRFVVDAKSIVGVLGLDLNRILTVSYSGYNPEFEKMINRLAKAG